MANQSASYISLKIDINTYDYQPLYNKHAGGKENYKLGL